MSLALMNIALAKLVVDLLAQSLKTSALPLFWAWFRESPSHLHCCRLPWIESTGQRAEKWSSLQRGIPLALEFDEAI